MPVEALPVPLVARGVELARGKLVLRYRPSETRIGEVIAAIESCGIAVADVSTVETDLEDVFLQLTGSAAAARAA